MSEKPASPEPGSGKASTPVKAKSNVAGSSKSSTTANTSSDIAKETGSETEDKLLADTEIKKEIVTDEDGSDYETDDDATDDADDHRLVIDESLKTKTVSDESNKNQSKKKSEEPKTSDSISSKATSRKSTSAPSPEGEISPGKSDLPRTPSSPGRKKTPGTKPARMPIKVKIVRKNKLVSVEKSNPLAVSPLNTEAGTSEVKNENRVWLVPFELGWKRELVLRATIDPSSHKKQPADVYYFGPCGQKLRSMPEIVHYLKERAISELSLSNFTFVKYAIYHPPEEMTRQAQQRGFGGKTPRAKKQAHRVVTPSVQKSTPTPLEIDSSPITPASISTPTSAPNSGPLDTSNPAIISTKRWRKRKALPPDFINTDKALSFRSPKELPSSPPIAKQILSIVSSQPLQSSPELPLSPTMTPPKPKRQLVTLTTTKAVNEPAVTSKDSVESPNAVASSKTEEKELPKRVVKRKIMSSPEPFITPFKKRKVLPPPIRKVPETIVSNTNVSPPEKSRTSKVVFTFSRMGAVPASLQNQATNKGTVTLLRVNPIQNPCTLSCPGLQGQVPDFPCSVCLLLFHSQCVGTKTDFVCQRCQKHAQVQPVLPIVQSTTPALTNGDANHNVTSPVVPEEVVYADKVNSDNYNDKVSEDEQLDEIDLASDDDDVNFLTVTPEVVMASPTAQKVFSGPTVITTEKPTVFIPPLPPLVRAPTLPNKVGSPTGTTFYQRLPPLGKPPALIRPVVSLSPPFGAASSQLRTLVSQIPPRQISPQNSSGPITSAIATVLPTVVGTNVTQIIAPIVPTPSVPVSLLSNSTPIVVGTQVLTPVSISMPGIAKGTVIYTNNPTLRFLLPSSEGMQTFIPNKPVMATPPIVEAAVPPPPIESAATNTASVANTIEPVTTNTASVPSTPIASTVETGVTVSSKFLVKKPPLVVNMRGKSICELVLLVGKAENGQKVTFVDQDEDVPIVEETAEINPPEGENQSSSITETSEDINDKTDEVNKVAEVNINDEEKIANEVNTEKAGDINEVSTSVGKESSGDISKNDFVEVNSSCSKTEESIVTARDASGSNETQSQTESSDNLEVISESCVATKESEPMDIDRTESKTNGDEIEKPTNDTSFSSEAKASDTDNTKSVSDQAQILAGSTQTASLLGTEGTSAVESDETAANKVENLNSGLTGESEQSNSSAMKDVAKGTSDSPEISEEVRPFSPLFTQEELENWDRESVSSNDEEEEYRPMTPIILCSQPYQDGYTRIRSTALTNRGAQLSCPADKCARVSCYRRPVTDLYADQEHAYCSPRGRQLFKQAGRKNMMTLKPPRRAFQQLLSACDALSSVFDYLSTADLLRASTVCRTWRKLASQPHQWATVKLKGLKVNNWKTCVKNLEFYGTTMLDMHGFEQEESGWHQFLAHIHHLRKLQGLVFGPVPAWVLQAVAISLPQLLCLEAEYIEPAKGSADGTVEDQPTSLDVGWWSSLLHLTVLRVRAPKGLACASFSPCGSFKALSHLTSLTHLSLTSLRGFSSSDGAFLDNLLHLQVLELGQCREWRDQAYQRLGKLRSLRRLRLEVGGKQGDRGLANALGHMNRLEELTLLSFKITTSLAASIRRLRHLWHLTIWPDMETEGAMVVYNTLQAVRSLKKLQSFSWGIIFTEKKSTRYSKKSTKYREAVDVDEWWSDELRQGHRAKSIKIPLLKAFSDEASAPTSSKGASTSNSMEQGLIGVGHLKHKLSKCLPDVEIYVYQVPETLLAKVYGTPR